MTQLIINADDFGQSESVNAGIAESYRDGVLTSATWLAGGNAAAAAAALDGLDGLDVGLHVALSGVRPVGDPSPFRDLLDREGRWPSRYPAVVRWLASRRDARALVETEWRAQIERFVEVWGRPPTHLDSHQHIALLPGLSALFARLASEAGVRAVRVPQEVRGPRHFAAPLAWHRPHETAVLSVLAGRLRRHARRAGLHAPDSFAGFRQSGRMDEATLLALLPDLGRRDGVVELMVHPGDADEAGGAFAYRRRQERDALTSPRVSEALGTCRLRLARFSDLP